jgi:hypothetical protein
MNCIAVATEIKNKIANTIDFSVGRKSHRLSENLSGMKKTIKK